MKTSLLLLVRSVLGLALATALVGTAQAVGGPGYALSFTGSGENVFVPHDPALNAYPLTVTAWFRTTQFGQAGLVTKSQQGSLNGWQVFLNGGSIHASYFANGVNYVWNGGDGLNGGSVANNTWHHVAFTVDAGGGRLYVDGVLKDSLAWTGTPGATVNGNELRLGAYASGNFPYNGFLDEVTVWNVALSQTQIQSNMNRSLAGTESGLVAYYRCDEGFGSIVADSAPAGGNNDGNWIGGGNFVPSGVQPFTPAVDTLPATALAGTQATLNGTANPAGTNTSAWFEWGTTTNYGNVTAAQAMGSGTFNVGYSQVITGLFGGVMYHFRSVASNSLGGVSGTNQSFSPPVFTDIGAGLPGASSAAWGDFDNDGRLDILANNGTNGPVLWRNTGTGFTNIITGLPPLDFDFLDYDNDGRLDILFTGGTGPNWTAQIWRNTGSGFLDINAGLTFYGAAGSGRAFGDYDNDGRTDVVLSGIEVGFRPFINFWRNNGGGFALATSAGFISGSAAAWGDYDSDGRLDILLIMDQYNSANLNYFTNLTQVWRNTGNGFSNINAGLPAMDTASGSVAWGDYDNDGRLDILLTGHQSNATNLLTQVWRNTGNGFSNINANLPGVLFGSAAWGDYDNDGRLDILLRGYSVLTTNAELTTPILQVWRNTGGGFTNISAGLPGLSASSVGSAAWGDYDNDGRLDILFTANGLSFGQSYCQVWRNSTPLANTPPTAPTGLAVSADGNAVTFSWNAATDAQTPASGLTYNLRVGSAPGAGDLVGPIAANGGQRRVVQRGNAEHRLFQTIMGLPQRQPLYWSVQAIDTAFAGSPFAAEQSFGFDSVITPPNGAIPGDINGDGIVDGNELNSVLSNYFPYSPWLYLTNVAGLGGTNVTFALSNSTAGAFSVEYSTNLFDWHFLGPATPRYLFTDTNAPAVPQRYYRLRWP
jgi:hypothetical protein